MASEQTTAAPDMTLRQFLRALADNPAPEDMALSANTLRAMLADIRDVAARLHGELQNG